jgi:hypothetical protein
MELFEKYYFITFKLVKTNSTKISRTRGKVQEVERKPKQRTGRGNNPRSKNNKWEITNDSTEPTV